MTAFDRLSPALQFHVANTLGFRELRPVQEQSIEPVLDGMNCVILAPTAGGKTEAAFFPLLSAIDSEGWRPVSVLYLSPIRALINDQEERVSRYAGLLGRRAFKWHGDVADGPRRRFLASPTDVLLITPESLEAMLMSSRVPARELLATVRTVVVDEVHAFAADDRGAHLSALLERLVRVCGRDVQRIGLSATVGNPAEILTWLAGSSRRPGVVVDPGGGRTPPELTLDHVGTLENAAHVIRALHPGQKRLVFVDSRGRAEELGKLLREAGTAAFVSHGSLSLPERRDAERAFHEGSDCVIVATSALELGIDVGDLDHVIQIDSPGSVASFLQRLGRTGRRAGVASNCTFLATKEKAVLQAAAIIRLFRQGYVEPIHPTRRAVHILAHQIMALAIASKGVAPGDWWAWLDGAHAFGGLSADERRELVDHMLATGILADQGGKLWLGPEGERRFGHAGFRELYAVFDSPRMIAVRCDGREIGSVDAQFLGGLQTGQEPGTFTLAGRPWQLVSVDWGRGSCDVRPAPAGLKTRWSGSPGHLPRTLCQAILQVLLSDDDEPAWSARARKVIADERAEHAFLRDGQRLVETADGVTWWTFAGGAANLLLSRMLAAALGEDTTAGNTAIRVKTDKGAGSVQACIDGWRAEGHPTEADALAHAGQTGRSRVSKFEKALPEAMLALLTAETCFDVEGARGAAAGGNRLPP